MQIRIGTRKSALALAQAGEVKARLQAAKPGLQVELVEITTSGDMFTDQPLADIGGKGLFTKEIEEALLDRRIDIAVHSVKDMQTMLPDGLILGCVPKREDARDVLIGYGFHSLFDLPKNATFGTASLRRAAQVKMIRPDVQVVPIRGNVQTRLDNLLQGQMQATMLARAGLNRLKLATVPGVTLDASQFIPAVGQGALGLECRADDTAILELLAPLHHDESMAAVLCERAFLRALDGSCRTPIAGHAEVQGGHIRFHGLIAKPDGSAHHKIRSEGNAADAERLGQAAGEEVKAKAGSGFL